MRQETPIPNCTAETNTTVPFDDDAVVDLELPKEVEYDEVYVEVTTGSEETITVSCLPTLSLR